MAAREALPAEAVAPEARCEECGRPFVSTFEMLEVGEGVYVHTHECEGFALRAGVTAPLIVILGALGVAGGFMGGLWLFARIGWLWPVALGVAVLACWCAVLVVCKAEG